MSFIYFAGGILNGNLSRDIGLGWRHQSLVTTRQLWSLIIPWRSSRQPSL